MTTGQKMAAFIAKYGTAAAKAAAGSKIFPQTILTAAALEGGYGTSLLASKYNNHFGIKADSTWKGKAVVLPTREQRKDGSSYTINAAFRVYDTTEESFANYVKFVSGPRYVKAGVLTAANPPQQFDRIHDAGYATDLSYSEKLKEMYNTVKDWVITNPGTTTATLIIGTLFFF